MAKVKLHTFEDGSYALGGRGYLSLRKADDNGFREGVYWSPHGFVQIWVSGNGGWTDMHMPRDGRVFHRKWRRIWGDRTITALARGFAEDVFSGRIE